MRAPFTHINEAWSRLILERLHDHGVRDLCIAPGSRSAPLTLAAARLERPDLALHTHFDERGLGFYALGLAKARGRPVALITTSGTAVPNLHPALVEAFQTHVPLVALTADRPPELLHCGANQAIEQGGIFARHVRAALELPPADEAVSAGWLTRALDRACAALRGPDRGPVHVNAPFREPLYGTSQQADFGPWRSDVRPAPEAAPPPVAESPEEAPKSPAILVAGQLLPHEARAVLHLAERTGVSILADIGSQLRLLDHPRILPHPELLLATPAGQRALEGMRQILQFGGRLTGKRLNQWLAGFPGAHWIVSEHAAGLDPQHRARHVQAPLPAFCEVLQLPPAPETDTARSIPVATWMDQALEESFSEVSAVRLISKRLPPAMALFPGNSMSVRLLDMVAAPGDGNPVLTNRGASGIDGLVATAAGYARHHGAGVTLVLGDLSLLHDLNSLHLAAHSPSPLVIVVLNNDGGAIFDLLPARDQGPHFEPFFQLPHGRDFAHAAAQFGLDYARPGTADQLATAYDTACERSGATLIELRFPPQHGADHLRSLLQRLQDTEAG